MTKHPWIKRTLLITGAVLLVALIVIYFLALYDVIQPYGLYEPFLVGKTSAQIEAKHGAFAGSTNGGPDEDGLYRDTACWYVVNKEPFMREPLSLFDEREDYEIRYYIHFDENGIAHKAYEHPKVFPIE